MTGTAASRARGGPMPSANSSDALTDVELTWIEGGIEYWIRFGHRAGERILDRRRRVVSFRPGAVFTFVRWAANDFGTVISRIDIVRAVEPGADYQTLPFVRPGGEILLKIEDGRRSRKWSCISMQSRAMASIPATSLPTIGAMSRTG